MLLKNSFIVAAIGAIVLVLPACWPNKKTQDSVAQHQTPKLHVINVLSEELYHDAHIPGSQSVPMDKVNDFAATTHKDDEIVVYCANYMCTASGAVAQQLKDKGFNKVYAYEAGIADWVQKGLPVNGPAKSAYLTAPSVAHHAQGESSIQQIATNELYDKMVNAGLIRASAIKESKQEAPQTVSAGSQDHIMVKE